MRLLAILLASSVGAQVPAKGFIVKADSQTVWLDLAGPDGAAPGRAFEIYKEGEELKHPVTGASLGRVEDRVAEGVIASVADKHSTGTLRPGAGAVKPGLRARWLGAAPAAVPAAESAGRAPKTRGATLDFAVVGMAVGDFDGTGRNQVALASESAVKVYAYPALDAKPLAEIPMKGTAVRVLGLEAGDVDGDGKPELFVAVYDDGFRRFETRVLRQRDGRWDAAAELPFLVRGYRDEAGKRALATQQVLDDKTFPFGSLYPLAWAGGKYVQRGPALPYKRADWLYGFAVAKLGDTPAVQTVTPVHALRVQLGSNWWRTPDDDYGQTPVRVRWQDRLLEFHPPMVVDGPALYAVRNTAALGGLASPFGVFNRGELHRKAWNGLAYETAWKAELPGCAQSLALVDAAPGSQELAVAIRGAADQSSVWTFEP